MTLFSLKDKVALVTGGSSGLGRQMAKVLAMQGANVVVVARNFEELQKTTDEIKALGGLCQPIKCDVTNEENIISVVCQIEKEYGKIDILVNNAGIASASPCEDTTTKDFKHVMDVNSTAVYVMAREVGKVMIKNKYGRIINIASMFGLVGSKFASKIISYHTSKGAVVNFTRGLAAEWAQHNITVNAIAPGYFYSKMTEAAMNSQGFLDYVAQSTCIGRVGKHDELDSTIVYLAAKESSYITGQTIAVDGGWTAI